MNRKTMNMLQPRQAGTHAGEGGNADEDRLVETVALASVGGSTQKVYWSKWQTSCRLRYKARVLDLLKGMRETLQ